MNQYERFKRGKSSRTAIFLLSLGLYLFLRRQLWSYTSNMSPISILEGWQWSPILAVLESPDSRKWRRRGWWDLLAFGGAIDGGGCNTILVPLGHIKATKGGWRAPKYVVVVIGEEEAWDWTEPMGGMVSGSASGFAREWMVARGGKLILGFGVRDNAYIVTTDLAKGNWA